jgi:uncharacterized protein YqhQ
MKEKDLKLPAYGGQALIEGVLMRGKYALAYAMRSPEGQIIVKTEKLPAIYSSKIRKFPFIRGLFGLWDAMVLGMRILTDSANLQTGEDEKIEGVTLILTVLFSLGMSILMFFVLPAVIGGFVENYFSLAPWIGSVIEGALRLLFIVLYIWGVGQIEDIKRVFSYHGAEHKTINAFESDVDLTPENVLTCSRLHPRCGTSFLLSVAVISIIIFTLIGPLPMVWRILTRILLIPLIAGIAYEYTRWTADNLDKKWIAAIAKPNMALQNLTTIEPDKEIVEVAIASFEAMLELENRERETRENFKE